MAGKRTYQFDIVAGIQGAIAAVDNLTDVTRKKLDSIDFKTGISAFRDGFDLVKGAAETAFNAISALASKSIDESLEAEKANQALANSLRLVGDFSADAVAEFDELAESIASYSTFTGDAVKESVALAKQFRATNAEAKALVRVSADLAAVQGISLEQATQKVAQTLSGFVDKSLVKVIPELKNLTKESLVAGDAIAVIGDRVRGSAEALGNTFAGALFRAEEAVNDIYETFGNLITQNPAITAGLNEIQKGLRELNAELKKSSKDMQALVTDGFLVIVESAPAFLVTIQKIANNLNYLGTLAQKTGVVLGGFAAALFETDAGKQMSIGAQVREDLEALDEQFGASINASEDFFNPLIAKTKEIVQRVKEVTAAARENEAATRNLGPSTTGEDERAQDIFNNPEDIRKRVESAAKEPLRFAFEAAVKAQKITAEEGVAIGAGLVANILKGAQGAQALLQQTLGAIGDAIIPGIGGAVSEIVGVLSQGPEKVREMVEGFVNAIPTLIENLANSLPVLIETLVRTLPPALAKAMPQVAYALTIGILENMPDIIKGFAQGLVNAAVEFVNAILDAIAGAATSIYDTISGSDDDGVFSGVPVLGGLGDLFGFAEGGRIPMMPQFQGDGAIIRADAGEQILSRDLSSDLERFLDNGGGGAGPTYVGELNIQMGLESFARISLEADKRGFRARLS